MMWQTKARREQIRHDGIRESLLLESVLVGSIARTLAAVRTGRDASESVIEDLIGLRERFQVSPEVLAKALIYHECILGTDEGLDADQNGGSLVREMATS